MPDKNQRTNITLSPRSKLLAAKIVTGLTLVVSLAVGVQSLPRLAAEQSLACRTCHVNPTGGGMRTEFGNYAVALNELCLPQTKEYFASQAISPRIAPALLVGFDSRYLVQDEGNLFRMQTDFYTDLNPLKNLHYQLRFSEGGISESYALAYFADQKYFVKTGRFAPAFGLKNSDHKAFVRERSGNGSNVYLDGISFGVDFTGTGNLMVESFNVGGQSVFGVHAYGTRYLAPVSILAGGSLRYSEKVNGSDGQFPQAGSVFAGLSYGRYTLMGELDLIGRSRDTLITYVNLTTRLEYGLYLIGEYNFFDGDRSFKSGVDEFYRLSVEIFPMPFVELRPSYTNYTRGYREGTDDFWLMVHVGY